MPARKETTIRGLRMIVEPDFGPRRLTKFPFYFESYNSSFRINLHRVAPDDPDHPWPDGKIVVEVVFEDETKTAIDFDLPPLELGEKTVLRIREVYVASPGQVILRIPTSRSIGPLGQDTWQTIYAYKVRTEESLWVSVFGPLILFGGITLGAFLQQGFSETTIQNIITLPSPAAQAAETVTPEPEGVDDGAAETPENGTAER